MGCGIFKFSGSALSSHQTWNIHRRRIINFGPFALWQLSHVA
jgi:hypothetical protein